ncbi:MAG: metallophosphoesterase, partial [Pseudomonadota bacterium]
MLIFMLIYFGIYGGMHLYFLVKTVQALQVQGWPLLFLLGFLLLMVNGPILVRILERNHQILGATILAWISYTWMAVLLWFVSLAAIRDLWNIGVRTAARITPESYRLIIPAKPAYLIAVVLIVVAVVWGFLEARNLETERVTIKSPLLPGGTRPVKIAQISDVHLGLIEGSRRIHQIASIIIDEKPDLLVCTGDLMDGAIPHLNHMSAYLAAIDPPLGKIAVTGNHEFYAGIRESLKFLKDSGFTVLRGESVIKGPVRVAGVDYPAQRETGERTYTDETAALAAGEDGRLFTILLKHQPLIKETSLGRFDIQLSGHTHKGQIFPFNYPVRLRYRYIAGLYDLGKASRIYTSRGTGT